MKKDQKTVKTREPITKEELLRRNPVPFGDVRKYYYIACVGTAVLLALCFHISVAAIALRTDTCVQIPNGIIAVLLICAILAIIGHQTRALAGYGLSAVCCLILILVMQLYNGGLALTSDLPEYGEVFRDGAKSTDFWIILAKVIAVVHLLLSVVFINSTLTVKEEPPLKGMNIKIQKIKDWFDKHNNSLPAGRRGSDYWFVAVSLILWMVFVAYDPTMARYDYWSMILLALACIFVACKRTFVGAFLFTSSALIRCTMYQYRFGLCIPVVVAYLAIWGALLYLFFESDRIRRKESGTPRPIIQSVARRMCLWIAVGFAVACYPIHVFLSSFSGSYMMYQKDNLPLIFFLPLVSILLFWSRCILGYLLGAGCFIWLRDALLHASPLNGGRLFDFSSMDEHGTIGSTVTEALNRYVTAISIASTIMAVVCICYFGMTIIIWRINHGKKESVVD